MKVQILGRDFTRIYTWIFLKGSDVGYAFNEHSEAEVNAERSRSAKAYYQRFYENRCFLGYELFFTYLVTITTCCPLILPSICSALS